MAEQEIYLLPKGGEAQRISRSFLPCFPTLFSSTKSGVCELEETTEEELRWILSFARSWLGMGEGERQQFSVDSLRNLGEEEARSFWRRVFETSQPNALGLLRAAQQLGFEPLGNLCCLYIAREVLQEESFKGIEEKLLL